EIYNYIELKEILKKQGYQFTTDGDTEIIPAAFDHWGRDCLHHFDGMFVFVLYDNHSNEVFIARDRFGEKPFYYAVEKKNDNFFSTFVFASEMKALWAIGISREYNGDRLLQYLSLGKVTGFPDKKNTFYKNIFTLPQGHFISIKTKAGKSETAQWYQPNLEIKVKGKDENNIIRQFTALLETSVSRRLRSHVNTGTSLSGGIDSATVAAMIYGLKNNGNYWKNTGFTASFPGFEKDELSKSTEVASFLHMQQEVLYPTENDWAENFEKIMYYQEEPLQSSSVLTQFMVYKKAKEKNITVLLDGQGADEILGGYTKYTRWYLQELLREDKSLFIREKKLLAANNFLENWDARDYAMAVFPRTANAALQTLQKKKIKNTGFIQDEFYDAHKGTISARSSMPAGLSAQLAYSSFDSGLDELLRYADRNSMANSVEVRLPFLSHELVEFVFSLPSSFKMKNGFTKWILRKAMENKLPQNIIWAKGKTGYEPPQKAWMKTKPIQEMIAEARIKLVDKNILQKQILQKPIMAKSAHAPGNIDWRFLCVAALLQ
ncbi:MAG: asparagine synthase (glutamine-hydrolyzing), partial [Chitinophagaceae bacterium]